MKEDMRRTSRARRAQQRKRRNRRIALTLCVMFVVLAASIGIFTQLFSRATAAADQSTQLCQAVNVAEDAAEEFSADPARVAAGEKVGDGVAVNVRHGYKVSCKISQDKRSAGTLWRAHITVSDSQGKLYSLDTSRYVSEVK